MTISKCYFPHGTTHITLLNNLLITHISSRDSRIPWVGFESLFLLMHFYRRKFEGSRKGALSLTSNLLVILIHSGPLYD
jgi:hypothetical protein